MNLKGLLGKTLHPSRCNGNAQVHRSTFRPHSGLWRNIPVGQSFYFPLHYHHYNCCRFLINVHDSSSSLFKPDVLMTPKWPWMWKLQWLRYREKLEIMITFFISPLTATEDKPELQALCGWWSGAETPGNPVDSQRVPCVFRVCPGAEQQTSMFGRLFTSSPKHTPPLVPSSSPP